MISRKVTALLVPPCVFRPFCDLAVLFGGISTILEATTIPHL
jgi:hypothetical protein